MFIRTEEHLKRGRDGRWRTRTVGIFECDECGVEFYKFGALPPRIKAKWNACSKKCLVALGKSRGAQSIRCRQQKNNSNQKP